MDLYDILAKLINKVLSAQERDELLQALEQLRQNDQAQQAPKDTSKSGSTK